MSAVNPVNWFEIPVNDLARAKSFYESILGIELTESEMGPIKIASFPMEQGAAGAAGSLMKGDAYTPSQDGTMVYLHVDDIEVTLGKINDSGGKTLMPKMNIGQHGFMAQFEDSEGNRVALHENP